MTITTQLEDITMEDTPKFESINQTPPMNEEVELKVRQE